MTQIDLKPFLFETSSYTAYNKINSGIKLTVHNKYSNHTRQRVQTAHNSQTDNIYNHYITSFDFCTVSIRYIAITLTILTTTATINSTGNYYRRLTIIK